MQMIEKSTLKNYDFIMTLGFYNPTIVPKCDVCLYPFLDCGADMYVRYEVGTEEGVVALFLYEFAKNSTDSTLKDFINALDYGYLSAETNVSEEEMDEIKNKVLAQKNPLLLIGDDISRHKSKINILNMLCALQLHSNIKILCDEILPQKFTLQPLANLPEHNGCVIFVVDFVLKNAKNTEKNIHKNILRISKEFARAWHLNDLQEIKFTLDSQEFCAVCKLDENFSGIIGILSANGIPSGYKTIAIKRV